MWPTRLFMNIIGSEMVYQNHLRPSIQNTHSKKCSHTKLLLLIYGLFSLQEEVVQWRLQSPQLKQSTPEQSGAPPGNNRDTPSKTYREQRRAEPSPISQLEEFQSEPEVGGTGRRRKVTPVPAPTRGGRPRRPRGGGGGGGTDLEAIPEVASSHSLHETTFS